MILSLQLNYRLLSDRCAGDFFREGGQNLKKGQFQQKQILGTMLSDAGKSIFQGRQKLKKHVFTKLTLRNRYCFQRKNLVISEKKSKSVSEILIGVQNLYFGSKLKVGTRTRIKPFIFIRFKYFHRVSQI